MRNAKFREILSTVYNNHSSVIFSIFLPECVTGLIKAEAVLPYVYHYCSQRIEAVMLAVPFTACSFCYMSKPRATLEAKIYPTFTIPKPKSFERQNSKALSLRPPKKVTSSFTTINNGRELDDIFWWDSYICTAAWLLLINTNVCIYLLKNFSNPAIFVGCRLYSPAP